MEVRGKGVGRKQGSSAKLDVFMNHTSSSIQLQLLCPHSPVFVTRQITF